MAIMALYRLYFMTSVAYFVSSMIVGFLWVFDPINPPAFYTVLGPFVVFMIFMWPILTQALRVTPMERFLPKMLLQGYLASFTLFIITAAVAGRYHTIWFEMLYTVVIVVHMIATPVALGFVLWRANGILNSALEEVMDRRPGEKI